MPDLPLYFYGQIVPNPRIQSPCRSPFQVGTSYSERAISSKINELTLSIAFILETRFDNLGSMSVPNPASNRTFFNSCCSALFPGKGRDIRKKR